MIAKEPLCTKCIHWDKYNWNEFSCQAFPKGIPDEILQGENDHTTPLPDQGNDIVFEPIENDHQ